MLCFFNQCFSIFFIEWSIYRNYFRLKNNNFKKFSNFNFIIFFNKNMGNQNPKIFEQIVKKGKPLRNFTLRVIIKRLFSNN